MRPTQMELLSEIDEQGGSMAMDVDDIDPIEVFGDGFFPIESKLTDTDFFNSFEDDFDDSDIN